MSINNQNQTSSPSGADGFQMKDSGFSHLGMKPADWPITRVKRLFNIYNGSTPKSSEPAYWGGSITWVTPSDLSSPGDYISDSEKKITESGFESCNLHMVSLGDLIISCRAPIGSIKIAGASLCTNQGCKSLVPSDEIITKYFFYQFSSLVSYLISLGRGSTFMELSTTDLADMAVVNPDTDTQKAIVSYLDIKCNLIDQQIITVQEVMDKFEELTESLITLVTSEELVKCGGLTDLLHKSSSEKADVFHKMSVNRVITSIKDGTHGTFARVASDYPLLSAKNVFDDGIHITATESTISESDYNSIISNGFPHKDDVLFCCVGSIGRTFVYDYDKPMAFQRSVAFLRPNQFITPYYLCYVLRSSLVKYQERLLTNKSAQEGLYLNSISKLIINVPEIRVQEEIVSFLDSFYKIANDLNSLYNKFITLLIEYKRSLIYEYVTGKKQVPQEVMK